MEHFRILKLAKIFIFRRAKNFINSFFIIHGPISLLDMLSTVLLVLYGDRPNFCKPIIIVSSQNNSRPKLVVAKRCHFVFEHSFSRQPFLPETWIFYHFSKYSSSIQSTHPQIPMVEIITLLNKNRIIPIQSIYR